MNNLTKDNFDSTISNGIALVDFWAGWCGYCRMMKPVIEELARNYEGVIKVADVNVDSEAELAERFGVTTLPTFVVFNDGKEVDRKEGFVQMEVLEEMLGVSKFHM